MDRLYRLDPAYRLDRMEQRYPIGRPERSSPGDRADRTRRADRREHADRAREPIYARLVAEWRAQGRDVPAEADVLRAVPGFSPRARSTAERT
ncbi:hypothetical protein ACH47Z_04645 [Streptomyces sp. NPDC020192]|uniref:hypothetical protein n=1 Tax=Streptomyces sp. NPDC020192 TaxID=3365066 RepID=UPI0037B7B5A3